MQGVVLEVCDFNRHHTRRLDPKDCFNPESEGFGFGVIPICIQSAVDQRILWETDLTNTEFNWMTNQYSFIHARKQNGFVKPPPKEELLLKYVMRAFTNQYDEQVVLFFIDLNE
jgi:hypothetical protein